MSFIDYHCEVFDLGQISSVSLIVDIICLVIIIFIVSRSAFKGFLSSIISFFGALISIIISYTVCKPVSEYIYSSFLENKIVSYITESIGNISTDNASHVLQKIEESIESLPSVIVSLFQSNGQSVVDIVTNNIGQSVDTIAKTLSYDIVKPLLITLISTISFIVIFIILSVLFGFLEKIFIGIKKVPIIGKLNSFLGAIFGVFHSLIILYIIYLVLNLATSLPNISLPYITIETLKNSYIFGWLSSFSLF